MALTAKQKRFCEEYVSNGFKLQKAYLDSHPDASPATANVNSWKLMKSDAIKDYIKELQKERVEQMNINADKILMRLNELAFEKDDASESAVLKALDLLQKQLGLQTQKVQADVKNDVVINIQE